MVRFALCLGLAAHIAIAIWNGFFGPSLGAEGDALNFHREAIYYANNLGNFEYVTGWVYSYFLGVLYSIFSDHIFFGSMISVFFWFLSCLILVKIMRIFNIVDQKIAIAILLFSLWPSALLNTSVTLRESFQTFGVSLIFLSSISYFVKRKIKVFSFLFGIVISSALHGALLVFSTVCSMYLFYHILTYHFKLGIFVRISLILFVSLISFYIGFYLLDNIAYNLNGGILEAVSTYNGGAISVNARADYRTDVDLSSFLSSVLFFPVAFIQYMIEPIPGRIGNIQDSVLFIENIVRLILLVFSIRINRKIPFSARSPHSFILFSYIGLSMIWAIGTVNWGTASRHHAPGLMLVVVAALSQFRSSTVGQHRAGRGSHGHIARSWAPPSTT